MLVKEESARPSVTCITIAATPPEPNNLSVKRPLVVLCEGGVSHNTLGSRMTGVELSLFGGEVLFD